MENQISWQILRLFMIMSANIVEGNLNQDIRIEDFAIMLAVAMARKLNVFAKFVATNFTERHLMLQDVRIASSRFVSFAVRLSMEKLNSVPKNVIMIRPLARNPGIKIILKSVARPVASNSLFWKQENPLQDIAVINASMMD